ncbi:IclR family transcriptional regulator domain-containing protein [Geodermatophilus ruber]|uniref:Transcriptional regulator, IclR family n=1 Tax=Geodermatophilus ruber TaxID=504800 RepID=A0A1I4DH66_9ACTN|nr:IclR family transcriptional regulator C-terminal domain-containing protein [Geodermatophilus ruber]SFK91466.1 transcriptional regulator, IclR family [Geodermatophilus ruber]
MEPRRESDPGGRPPEGMAGLAKGLAVIEAFGPDRPQLSVTDAARATATSPATARRCLLTLEQLGYVSFDGKFFRPTPRMVRLGAAYLETASLPSLAQPLVLAARDELGESVSLAVLEDDQAVFIARAEVQRIVSTGVRLGAQLPAHASATGRVLLAGLPDDQVDDILQRSRPQATTSNTLVTVEQIRARVRQAREECLAYTDEELELGMRTMAVPVHDSHGRTRAALSVSSFAARASLDDMRTKMAPVLQGYAERLGRML